VDLDRFGVIEILESHDGLNEEGLGIFKIDVQEDP